MTDTKGALEKFTRTLFMASLVVDVPATGCTARTIPLPPLHLHWRSIALVLHEPFEDKEFVVRGAIGDDDTVYVQPERPYWDATFEHLFQFGMQCEGFDRSRTVRLSLPFCTWDTRDGDRDVE